MVGSNFPKHLVAVQQAASTPPASRHTQFSRYGSALKPHVQSSPERDLDERIQKQARVCVSAMLKHRYTPPVHDIVIRVGEVEPCRASGEQ